MFKFTGDTQFMKLGEKDVVYNPTFKFYITTKLSNPHYAPEISSTTAIVNFAVKEQGLEAQLLGTVVRKERPDLEEQVINLILVIFLRFNISFMRKKPFCLRFKDSIFTLFLIIILFIF